MHAYIIYLNILYNINVSETLVYFLRICYNINIKRYGWIYG